MNLFKISQLLDVVTPDYPPYRSSSNIITYLVIGALVVAIVVGLVILLKNKNKAKKTK